MITDAILNRAQVPPTQWNPELPPMLETIIGKALEKDRERRYQSAVEMRADLQKLKQLLESGRLTAPDGAKWLSPGRYRQFLAFAVAVILLAAAGGFAYRYLAHRNRSGLTSTDTIVLADFANSTGDAVFDDTLKQGLAVELAQSPMLNILPEQKVRSALREMTRSPDEVLSTTVAQEVCERTASRAYIVAEKSLNFVSNPAPTLPMLCAESISATRLKSNSSTEDTVPFPVNSPSAGISVRRTVNYYAHVDLVDGET